VRVWRISDAVEAHKQHDVKTSPQPASSRKRSRKHASAAKGTACVTKSVKENEEKVKAETKSEANKDETGNIASDMDTIVTSASGAAVHYDAITLSNVANRDSVQSIDLLGARRLNNWIKEIVMQAAVGALVRVHPGRKTALAVLDLAGGRGGDVGKFQRCVERAGTALKAYGAADVSEASVAEARARAEVALSSLGEMRVLVVCDMARESALSHIQFAYAKKDIVRDRAMRLSLALNPGNPFADGRFRLAWSAYALHYFACGVDALRNHLRCVSRALEPGGLFVATYVSAESIIRRLARASKEESDTEFVEAESSLWRIQMSKETLKRAVQCLEKGARMTSTMGYGLRYRFWMPARAAPGGYLVNGDEVEEFLLFDDELMRQAQAFGLRPVFEAVHGDIIQHAGRTRFGGDMMRGMGICRKSTDTNDDDLPSQVSPKDYDLASFYKTVAFSSCIMKAGALVQNEESVLKMAIQLAESRRGSQPCDALGVAMAHDLGLPKNEALPYPVPALDDTETE